ncbi:MAG: sugar phosphate isomerase/epimerase [Geminicoccaceae bacterium]|nr:sugar phosphate isomerase/epimerase [Geminicoccaceae bacterium]
MRISLCNEVVRGLEFPAQCALARGLGYDGLELAPFTLGHQPHRLAAVRRAQLRRIAEDHGISITGLHWLLVTPDGLSITSRNEGTRARTLDVMRRLIELCADLGGSVLVHGSPKQRPIERGDTREVALARAVDCFAAIAADAEQAGVTYCIEPLAPAETRLINTVEEAALIVEQIGSPALRTMIDTCAAGQGESATACARPGRAGLRADPGGAPAPELRRPVRGRALRLHPRWSDLGRSCDRLPARPRGGARLAGCGRAGPVGGLVSDPMRR